MAKPKKSQPTLDQQMDELLEPIEAQLAELRAERDEAVAFTETADRMIKRLERVIAVYREEKPRAKKKATTKSGQNHRQKRVPLAERQKVIMEILRDHRGEPMTASELAQAAKTSPSTVQRAVGSLDTDLLEVVRAQGVGTPHRYRLRETAAA